VAFVLRFHEQMKYGDCGPNEGAGVLAENGTDQAELTFHFGHTFGDFDEGEADPTDPETINYVAIGFGPFAEMAEAGQLDIDQNGMGNQMNGVVYQKLIDAVRTLGHSGEGHCHLN